MILGNTSAIIQVITASAVTVDVTSHWVDKAAGVYTPDSKVFNITTATTTTVVLAPAASTQRHVELLTLRNKHASSSNAVTVQLYDGTATGEICKYTLLAGEELFVTPTAWWVLDASGSKKITTSGIVVASGKTLTVSNSLTLAGTDGSTLNIGTGGTLGTAAYTAATAYDAAGAAAAVTPTTLGLVIGTNVQAYDADLTTWSGVTPGTGVATALAVNVGSAGAFVTFNGALGTPSSGTVTNLTGTASININGTVGATSQNTLAATTGNFTDTTNATSTTAAALKSAGGMAAAANIWGGNIIKVKSAGGGGSIAKFSASTDYRNWHLAVGDTGVDTGFNILDGTNYRLSISDAGVTSFPVTTDATSSTAASVTMAGGLGVVGKVISAGGFNGTVGATTPASVAGTTGSFSSSLAVTGKITGSAGMDLAGSPSGYTDEARFTSTGANAEVAISSLATSAAIMNFDHRGTSNTGSWKWRNGTGAASTHMTLSGAGVLTLSALASGNLTSASGVITSSSDERLKDVVGPLEYGINEVMQLRPIRYHWNKLSGIPTEPEYGGFGAAQVEQSMPLAVSYGKDGYRGLNDRVILGATVNAIQNHDRRIADLEAQIKQLKH